MIYLTTGSNGAGKTLNVLKWVRDQQLKESRPVYYNGRFDMVADFGWLKCDFADWQTLPDGSIFLVDECQNDMPVRGNSAAVPDAIKMLAEHRRRGFDFYLITQHPQNIDLFVRRLIGPPGWHRHLKRSFGANLVSCLEWGSVNPNCEKAGAGKDAKIKMIPFPKDVFTWYNSAMLHTGKKSIPLQVFVLVGAVLVVPVLGYFGFQSFWSKSPSSPAVAKVSTSAPVSVARSDAVKVLSSSEYAATFSPRVAGFPGSAPRYDSINQAVVAPKPSACIVGKRPGSKSDSCLCYSQQATRLQVPDSMCREIAASGWFDDTLQAVNHKVDGVAPSLPKTSVTAVVAVGGGGFNLSPLMAPPETKSIIERDVEVLSFMRKRQYLP